MDFQFTEEQLMIQDVARRIAAERIAPSAEHHDRTGEFPLENMKVLGENGLMGVEVPAEYGGAGMDPISYVLAMIEVAAADLHVEQEELRFLQMLRDRLELDKLLVAAIERSARVRYRIL